MLTEKLNDSNTSEDELSDIIIQLTLYLTEELSEMSEESSTNIYKSTSTSDILKKLIALLTDKLANCSEKLKGLINKLVDALNIKCNKK